MVEQDSVACSGQRRAAWASRVSASTGSRARTRTAPRCGPPRCRAVADVAVIGVPDDDWGQRAVALVEPAEGAAPGEGLAAEVLAHCEPRLAKLKHPRRLEFRESLPRTPSEKLGRRRVREDYLRERAG
ncbi:hypothetical protein GWI34_20550 [Actinomadura sp. DSM 109109]|nr:hypothetical protein [Actinomadura lepetitiana]